jgi:hypothetical protein
MGCEGAWVGVKTRNKIQKSGDGKRGEVVVKGEERGEMR